MPIKTLYQTSDGRVSESKKQVMEWEAELELTKATEFLLDSTVAGDNALIAKLLIEQVTSTKEGYEAIKHLYKACHRHNHHFKPVRTSTTQDEHEMIKELGWEALEILKNMVKFCLKNGHATGAAEWREIQIQELIRFSGYVSE